MQLVVSAQAPALHKMQKEQVLARQLGEMVAVLKTWAGVMRHQAAIELCHWDSAGPRASREGFERSSDHWRRPAESHMFALALLGARGSAKRAAYLGCQGIASSCLNSPILVAEYPQHNKTVAATVQQCGQIAGRGDRPQRPSSLRETCSVAGLAKCSTLSPRQKDTRERVQVCQLLAGHWPGDRQKCHARWVSW